MTKTYNHRYLKDSSGEIFLPMTSVDCLIDYDKKDNTNDILDIQSKLNDLKTLVESQGKEIETLKAKLTQKESEGIE